MGESSAVRQPFFGLLGLPANVVGTQRGIVTPGDGRPPDITETQLFSTMFLVLIVVEGLLFESSLPPPQATSPRDKTAKDPMAVVVTRNF
jgi:hypothetical protein